MTDQLTEVQQLAAVIAGQSAAITRMQHQLEKQEQLLEVIARQVRRSS